jgi:hypothetical protein
MKRLFVAALVCSYVGVSFGADIQSTAPDQMADSMLAAKDPATPLSFPANEASAKAPINSKTSAKNAVKTFFSSSSQKNG